MPNIALRCCVILAGWSLLHSSSPAAVSLSIGQNFTGATYGTDSQDVPPDAGLAVGPNHVVEFVNGRFSVFAKSTGTRVLAKTDLSFWTSASVSVPSGGVSDPRILFDTASQRWFAAMIDVPSTGGNNFLLAVSATADPTGAWQGVTWPADPVNGNFADFPTLGIDAAGVYLSGDMFSGNNSVGSMLHALPKQDLLASSPSIAGLTASGLLSYATYGAILQPAVTVGPVSGPESVLAIGDLGYDLQPHSTLVSCSVQNAGVPNGAAVVSPVTLSIPAYTVPINPPQPGGVDNLDDGDARISSMVYRVGDLLYAAHAVQVNNRAAIQWFVVNATNQTLVDTGTLADPVLHLFYPSIAANTAGTVVIAYNASGTNMFISSYAVAGDRVNGSLSFGNPVLLKAGVTAYRTNNPAATSRWGDYSAISPDPNDPNRFWSLTEYPSSSTAWSTEITELITTPLTLTISFASGSVQCCWSASFTGFQLESTPGGSPANWTVVPQAPVLANGQYCVTLSPTNSAAFFRLVK